MIRILQVVGGLGRGGTESVIMNYYRQIDKDTVQFDFISHHPELNDYEEEIKNLGGRIFYMPEYRGTNHVSYCRAWKVFFSQHPEYKIIHAHAWSTAVIYLQIARQFGLYTVSHSHSVSARTGLPALGRLLLKKPLPLIPDYFMACSKAAAIWLYGKSVLKRTNFSILPNAINVEQFRYSPGIRKCVRTENGVQNCFVIGHVGVFDHNKNHEFMVDLFRIIHSYTSKTVLWLIGEGSESERIKERVRKLELSDHVKFWGARDDVADLMQAMDLFLFPSHFESFGNAALEAQAAGLPVLCSDTIPDEVKVSNRITFLSLTRQEVWVKRIMEQVHTERHDISDLVKGTKYDIEVAAAWLQNFYLSAYREKQIKNNSFVG